MAESKPRIASLLLQLVPVAQMRISQMSAKLPYSKNQCQKGPGCDSGTMNRAGIHTHP